MERLNSNALNINNIAENKNGEIFTHEIEADEDSETFAGKNQLDQNLNKWLMASFIGIIVIGFILFIYFYRKKK